MNSKTKECIFCKIANQQLPATFIYQDDIICVFKDINPKASTHLLLIPKLHINSLADLQPQHSAILTHALYKIPEIAKLVGLAGFKTIVNTGREGGQIVDHLHFHILSGDYQN